MEKRILSKPYEGFNSLMEERPLNSVRSFCWYFSRVLFILISYSIINRGLIFITKLPVEDYYSPVLIFEFLSRLFTTKLVLILLISLFFFTLNRKRLFVKWSRFGQGKHLRPVILMTGAILTWMFSLYDYNLFYNQSHVWDRILLVVFLTLIYIRPFFSLPFIVVLLIIVQQFKNLVGYSWAVPSLFIGILLLFIIFYFIYLLSEKFIYKDFIFLLICFFASHYWLPGSGKVNLYWITENRLSYLISSTYTNGWLAFLNLDQIDAYMGIIDNLNTPLKVFTILLEFGSMFIFFNKKTVRLFFVGWIFMHLGIFFTSGICFWAWILLESIFLIFFIKKDNLLINIQFTKIDLIVGGIIIVCGSYWSTAVKLCWYDTPLSYVYRYEATTENGKTIQLPHTFFAPYDYQFTINSLSYLSRSPLLESGQNPEIIKDILSTNTPNEFFTLEQKKGRLQYDDDKTEKLNLFVRQYVKNWNRKQSKKHWLSSVQAPRLLWTFPREPHLEEIGKIQSLRIKQVTSLYLGAYEEIREREVLNVQIVNEE